MQKSTFKKIDPIAPAYVIGYDWCPHHINVSLCLPNATKIVFSENRVNRELIKEKVSEIIANRTAVDFDKMHFSSPQIVVFSGSTHAVCIDGESHMNEIHQSSYLSDYALSRIKELQDRTVSSPVITTTKNLKSD